MYLLKTSTLCTEVDFLDPQQILGGRADRKPCFPTQFLFGSQMSNLETSHMRHWSHGTFTAIQSFNISFQEGCLPAFLSIAVSKITKAC